MGPRSGREFASVPAGSQRPPASSLFTALTILREFLSRLLWVALSDTGIIVVTAVTPMGLHLRPRRFVLAINLLLGTVFVVGLIRRERG